MTPASKPDASSLDREARGDVPSSAGAPSGLISLLVKERSAAHNAEKFSDQQLQLAATVGFGGRLREEDHGANVFASERSVALDGGLVPFAIADRFAVRARRYLVTGFWVDLDGVFAIGKADSLLFDELLGPALHFAVGQ